MVQIVRVDTVDGSTLDIELNNGHLILFDMDSLLQENPAYQPLQGKEVLSRPKTDGQKIFWDEGPQLTLAEILMLLGLCGHDGTK